MTQMQDGAIPKIYMCAGFAKGHRKAKKAKLLLQFLH